MCDERHGDRHFTEVAVVMGVSGVGKSTIGKTLATRLGWSFVDGDDLHSATSVAKMMRGEPLSEDDRRPWLEALHAVITDHRLRREPLVLACSALRASYRKVLGGDEPEIRLVYLTGDPSLIAARLGRRSGHFMPTNLLSDQLSALEPPPEAITVGVDHPVEMIVATIIDRLGQ